MRLWFCRSHIILLAISSKLIFNDFHGNHMDFDQKLFTEKISRDLKATSELISE